MKKPYFSFSLILNILLFIFGIACIRVAINSSNSSDPIPLSSQFPLIICPLSMIVSTIAAYRNNISIARTVLLKLSLLFFGFASGFISLTHGLPISLSLGIVGLILWIVFFIISGNSHSSLYPPISLNKKTTYMNKLYLIISLVFNILLFLFGSACLAVVIYGYDKTNPTPISILFPFLFWPISMIISTVIAYNSKMPVNKIFSLKLTLFFLGFASAFLSLERNGLKATGLFGFISLIPLVAFIFTPSENDLISE